MAKRAAKKSSKKKDTNANLGFEAKLWLAADKLRNNMDAAEYKHTVLGLIFLKYISDAFDEHHAKLVAGEGDYEGADPEDADEYRAENVFWVPKEARWQELQNNAKQPTIGKLIDDAMDAIERDNPKLKGTLTKNYARPALDKQRLGELIDLIGTIDMIAKPDSEANGDDKTPAEARAAHRSKDILGRVYEYFLSEFASAEGKKGGQFYTPSGVLQMGDGYRAKRLELAETGLPFVRAGNLQDGGFAFEKAEFLCEESSTKAGEKNSQPFDVAFTSKGTVGRMTMVTPSTRPFVYSPQVCWWRVADRENLDPHVLYRWMESNEFMHQVAMVKGQTDMADYVSLRDQRAMRVNLPPVEAQHKIAPCLKAIDNQMAGNRSESLTLSTLRDTLLPKLLSGELPVPAASEALASVQG